MASFEGYLVKIGNYVVPMRFMAAESYSCGMKVQDLDSYTDANGVLHRNVIPNAPLKVEFNTPPMLTDLDFDELFTNIEANYTDARERKCTAKVWNQELRQYKTADFYIPDIDFTVYGYFNGRIIYNGVRIALIGY